MNTPPTPSTRLRCRGFTLMELLIVISLIAVLAGLVLASAGGVMKKIKRDQIRNFLAEIESGLEDYKIDNAIYPLNPERANTGGGGGGGAGGYGGPDAEAVGGATVLYKHLSGDFDLDGQVDENATVYVERLDYWSNSEHPGMKAPEVQRSVPFGSSYAVVDPLGSPLRYLAAPLGTSAEHQSERDKIKQKNPTFDLWSVAGATSDSPDFSDESTWITNWGSN